MSYEPYAALFRRFELNWSSDAMKFLCKVSYRSLYDYSQIQTSYTKHITKSKTAKICVKHIEIQANIRSTETILLQFKKQHFNKTTKLHIHDSKCSWIATRSCE